MLLGSLLATQWADRTGRKPCLVSGVHFKYPVGVVFSISGSSFGGLSQRWSLDLRQVPGEGAWDETSTQTFQTLWIYGCQWLGWHFQPNNTYRQDTQTRENNESLKQWKVYLWHAYTILSLNNNSKWKWS